MVALCVWRGFDVDYVLDLPIPNFTSLVKSVTAVIYQQKIEDAWTAMFAAQGTVKGMTDWVEQQFRGRAVPRKKAKKGQPKEVDDSWEALARDLKGGKFA